MRRQTHSHITVNRSCSPAVNERNVVFVNGVNAPEDCKQHV